MRPTKVSSRAASLTAALMVVACALSACSTGDPVAVQHPIRPSKAVPAGLDGVGALPAPASAWPTAQYDARHSSATRATGPQKGSVRWTRHLGGSITPGPVIGIDGLLIVATNSGVLRALDRRTGTTTWAYEAGTGYGNDLSTSPSILGDGTILWPGPNNTLYALSRGGDLLWKEPLGSMLLTPAVAGRDRVYVADMAGELTAWEVRGREHRRLWSVDVGGTNYASPSVGPEGNIYLSTGDALVAVRDTGLSGRELWRFPVKHMIEVSSAVSPRGIVVIGTNNDGEYGLRPDGTQAWRFDIDGWTYSSTAVRPDGTGYFGDNDGRVRAFNSSTGTVARTVKPEVPAREHVWTSVVADASGNSYWGSTKGRVYGYGPTGRQLFTLPVDGGVWSYPALDAEGSLYLGTTSGTLYAIGS